MMLKPQQWVDVIDNGGVIAYPTEAVWGLGCDPWQRDAVQRILDIKRRPVEKGLIVVIGNMDQLDRLSPSLTRKERDTVMATWPGPVSWLVPAGPDVPEWVRGDHDSIAVRWSAHPLVQALTDTVGHPLVSTSANRAGKQPARFGFQVRQWLGDEIDWLVPGQTGRSARPSQIRRLSDGAVIRS